MFVGRELHHAWLNSLKHEAYKRAITLLKSASDFSLSQCSSRCLSKSISSSVVFVGASKELTNFYVIFKPVTLKKYHVSGWVLASNNGFAVSFQWLQKWCSCFRPNKPPPLRSVTGSYPWNPISIHCLVYLASRFLPGISMSHSCSSITEWCSSSYLSEVCLQKFSFS